MIIIGIGHKARQGKDTLAKHIILAAAQQKGIYGKQYGFADALRATCRVFGMREKDPLVLQAFGTNVMRAINREIWLTILADTLVEQQPELAVITDVRFFNEAKLLRSMGSTLIRLERIDSYGERFLVTDRDPNHPSETELDNYDWHQTIQARDIADLTNAAQYIVKSFL